ncbi:MAG: ubiquitin-like small modifier protein 1 [Syntrophothermus sp.]
MPTVKLFANLRKLAGTKEVSIAGETLGAVLRQLAKTSPSLEILLLEKNELRPHVIVTLNGHNTNELNTQVTEQDVIAVFPPIAGGA